MREAAPSSDSGRTIADYLNRYAGRRFVIVGKGPTAFEWPNLADVTDPIIFINDAVQWESHATNSDETFFFALDEPQSVWLTPNLTSTAVIPRAPGHGQSGDKWHDRLFASAHPEATRQCKVATYEWGPRRHCLRCTREQVAERQVLFRDGGTIHSAIHFAWLCGATEIAFIGCDGIGRAYDHRLELRSNDVNLGVHAKLRNIADRECEQLNLDIEYIHEQGLAPRIPRICHFVWIGEYPTWLDDMIGAFREHNPKWHINLWRGRPDDFPESLIPAYEGCRQKCQWADILYCWLLYSRGGVVCDTDSLTLKSFDPLRLVVPAWTTWHIARYTRLANGVMGSVVRGKAFELTLARIAIEHTAWSSGQKGWTRCMYGPDMLTAMFGEHGTHDMRIVPYWYFYPFDHKQRFMARGLLKASLPEREVILDMVKNKYEDSGRPYATHMWGMHESSRRGVNE